MQSCRRDPPNLTRSDLSAASISLGAEAGSGRKVLGVPGSAGGRHLSRDELEKLLSEPSPLRGFQKKAGMLNPEEWLPEFELLRRKNKRAWVDKLATGEEGALRQPPHATNGCQVLVNHKYRFFWIKTRKTGGTTLRDGLGSICWNGSAVEMEGKPCMHRPWPESPKGNPESWWKEYFVFAAVRNPYSRFASAHAYSQEWNCYNQTFGESCKDPFIANDNCHGECCCVPKTVYMNHMREQTSCLFTRHGELAVDFIAQTENMSEDYPIIMREINKRRKAGTQPLSEVAPRKVNANKNATNGYSSVYEEYPECIGYLDKLLATEFRDLRYAALT